MAVKTRIPVEILKRRKRSGGRFPEGPQISTTVRDLVVARQYAKTLTVQARKGELTKEEERALNTVESLLKLKMSTSGVRRPLASARARITGQTSEDLATRVFEVRESWMISIRCELYEALCKKSRKYFGLLSKLRNNIQLLIGAVGMAVASAIGFSMGVVAALVSSILALILKIGLAAFCRQMRQNNECGG